MGGRTDIDEKGNERSIYTYIPSLTSIIGDKLKTSNNTVKVVKLDSHNKVDNINLKTWYYYD